MLIKIMLPFCGLKAQDFYLNINGDWKTSRLNRSLSQAVRFRYTVYRCRYTVICISYNHLHDEFRDIN